MILIREVADASTIMGTSKPAGLQSPYGEVKSVNPLFVGIDESSRTNIAYLMNPNSSRHSNSKQVKKFKKAYPNLPKNDFVDAFAIADYLRFGRIAKEVYKDSYRYQALRALTRARFDVIQNLTREK